MHMYTIGSELVTQITALLATIATERADDDTAGLVSRTSLSPYVSLKKRRSGRGREEGQMRIEEGITIVPMKPRRTGGTNERDDKGYVFLVAIADGTWTDEIEEHSPIGIWEQAIGQRFMHQRLGVTLSSGCELGCIVEPGALPEWATLKDGIDLSLLKITCFVRESRRYAE